MCSLDEWVARGEIVAVEGLWCQTNLSVLDSRHVNIPVPRLRELPINNRAGSRFPDCF